MKHNIFLLIIMALGLIAVSIACTTKKETGQKPAPTEVVTPDWAKNAVIYEVNIRQFSKEGTFNAFANDLPRLKDLGIDILWLMPIHPVGIKNRKGELGSPYSVQDYAAVNPEYGTMADFKNLVAKTHELGMKLIIDWVPNHSAWDHPLTISNPDYYRKDSTGNFESPFDWTDVIRFDYENPNLRKWMVDQMKFWLTEANIDGFRCDVAHMVPVEFWDSCRTELDKVKPIFFLAEAEQHWLHKKAFDMSYGWEFHHIMNEIAKGKKNAKSIEQYFEKFDTLYPQGSVLMQFTSNHDENSWAGTEFERMGDGAKAFAVLAATVPGMLLIYNGQESAFNRRLEFFVKDSISWENYSYTGFYKNLIKLKKENTALWNGFAGGNFSILCTNEPKNIAAFMREKDNNRVVVFINLSKKEQSFKIKSDIADGAYTNAFDGSKTELKYKNKISLKPWDYLVLVRN